MSFFYPYRVNEKYLNKIKENNLDILRRRTRSEKREMGVHRREKLKNEGGCDDAAKNKRTVTKYPLEKVFLIFEAA